MVLPTPCRHGDPTVSHAAPRLILLLLNARAELAGQAGGERLGRSLGREGEVCHRGHHGKSAKYVLRS